MPDLLYESIDPLQSLIEYEMGKIKRKSIPLSRCIKGPVDHRQGDKIGQVMEAGDLHFPLIDPGLERLHALVVHDLLEGFRLLSKHGSDVEPFNAVSDALVLLFEEVLADIPQKVEMASHLSKITFEGGARNR